MQVLKVALHHGPDVLWDVKEVEGKCCKCEFCFHFQPVESWVLLYKPQRIMGSLHWGLMLIDMVEIQMCECLRLCYYYFIIIY